MTITLRRRKTKKGKITLYLDCYHRGRRRLEYLSLYLTGNRHDDKETLRLAEARLAQRRLEAFADQHGLPSSTKQKKDFIEYSQKLGEGQRTLSNRRSWQTTLRKFEAFAGHITFEQLSAELLERFREHLLSDLNPNSVTRYMTPIKMACRQATKARILPRNPAEFLTPIKKRNSQRTFLTLKELQKLKATECSHPVVKDAFLFAAFSGLRFCDIKPLTWGSIHRNGQSWTLEFTQTKTGNSEVLPLSEEATAILSRILKLATSTRPESPVFALPAHVSVNRILKRWARRAGLEKNISFHCGRHTFATLGLNRGIDLYVISKLLGHQNVSTTQIYAQVIDQRKHAAVKLFPRLSEDEGRDGNNQ